MLIPYLSLLVKQDAYTSTKVTVPPHEMAILTVIFGNPNVGKPKIRENLSREVDPYEEYERLHRKYGNSADDKRPWIEVVFGRFPEGRFERTMKEGAKHYFKKSGRDKNGNPKAKKPKNNQLSPQQRAANTRAANRLKAEQETVDGEDAQATA